MSVAAPIADVHPARQRALDPYLRPLREWYGEQGAELPEGPVGLDLGGRTFIVDSPELALIWRWRANDEPDSAPLLDMLSQCLALQAKSTEDLERLVSSPDRTSQAVYALQAELMLDYAIGIALVNEIQGIIHGAVREGHNERARELSRFRNKMQRWIQRVRGAIAESERERAHELSSLLTTATEQPVQPDPELLVEEPAPRLAPRVRRKRRRSRADKTDEPRDSTTRLLLLALGLSAALWALVVGRPVLSTIEPLGLADLGHIECLVGVESRPPSLYLRADTDMWGRLDEPERRSLLASVAEVASEHGYRGLTIEDREGRPLAQWLALRGSSLIRIGESPQARDATVP